MLEELITDEVRAEVFRIARIETKRLRYEARLTAAKQQAQAAVESDDEEAEEAAEVKVGARERMLAKLVVPTLDFALFAEPFRKAGDMIAGAVHTLPIRPPFLSYSLELAAWRSCGPITIQTTDPPVLLAGELDAVQLIEQYIEARARQVESLRVWQADVGVGDPFSHLAAVAPNVQNCRLLIEEYDRVTTIVADLNDTRTRTGSSWAPPHGAGSPEVQLMLTNRYPVPALATKGPQ